MKGQRVNIFGFATHAVSGPLLNMLSVRGSEGAGMAMSQEDSEDTEIWIPCHSHVLQNIILLLIFL